MDNKKKRIMYSDDFFNQLRIIYKFLGVIFYQKIYRKIVFQNL